MAGAQLTEIRRYPVKSMLGEVLTEAVITTTGVDGDRAYALVDDETGKVVSAKRPSRWGRMFELTARTTPGGDVEVSFPDGSSARVGDRALVTKLSEFFGRPVSITTVAADDATFDEEWAGDLKGGARPYFDMPSRMEDEGEVIDAAVTWVPGRFFDFGPLHLITTSTLRALASLSPDTRFDVARFRPNLVVDTPEEGFVETAWQGQIVTIGEVETTVMFTVPRCVMTTLPQGDLPADRDVLRTIAQHNKVELLGGAAYPCAGVYVEVLSPGTVRVGDRVEVRATP